MTETVHSTLQITGKTLEVAQHRCPEYPRTIVLLHEALGSIKHWRDFPSRLAHGTRCNVVLYSRAGHGHSEGPVEPRGFAYIQRQANVVLRTVLERLEIHHPILFGHSEGAVIALFYAATHPQVPRALILESAVVQIEDATMDGVRKAREAYRSSDLKDKLQKYHSDPDAVFGAFAGPWMAEGAPPDAVERYLKNITCPTLVLQGDRDEYGSPKQSEILSQHLPNARSVLVSNCGHTPHREHPQMVLDEIRAFLSGHTVLK